MDKQGGVASNPREERIEGEAWKQCRPESEASVQDLHKQKRREVKRITMRDKRRFYDVKAEEAGATSAKVARRTLYRIVRDHGFTYSYSYRCEWKQNREGGGKGPRTE